MIDILARFAVLLLQIGTKENLIQKPAFAGNVVQARDFCEVNAQDSF